MKPEDVTHLNVPYWRSVAVMVGGIVGVGVFGLPFVFAQSGYATGLAFLAALGLAMLVLNLMYGEIVLQTPGRHRIGGYVAEYLGEGWGRVATLSVVATVSGAMLAFMIVGGGFLHGLLSPMLGGGVEPYAFAMAALVAVASSRGLKLASRIEALVVASLLFLFVLLALAALPHASPGRLLTGAGWSFAPYGAVLFSLSGIGIVAEMRDVLARQERLLPKAVVAGLAIVLALYALFTASVVAALGEGTTPVALDGLVGLLGRPFFALTSALGTLTVFSIFLTNAVQLQNLLCVDAGASRRVAWTLSCLAAPALYLMGARDFIAVIGFVGAVFGGIIGLFILATYEAMRRSRWCKEHRCLDVPVAVSALIAVSFIIGIVAEIIAL